MNTLTNDMKVALYHEITEHLLKDEKPSDYLQEKSRECEFQEYPFHLLIDLKKTEQSEKYHPEGSVWNHTMLVLDEAAKVITQSKNPKAFMWAALLHDIGKPGTTRMRKGRITSYDHDREGEKISREFLSALTDEEVFIEQVSALVRYHMHMLYVLKNLPFQDIKNMVNRVELEEIALLSKCDRLGRMGADRREEEEQYQEYRRRLKKEYDNKINK